MTTTSQSHSKQQETSVQPHTEKNKINFYEKISHNIVFVSSFFFFLILFIIIGGQEIQDSYHPQMNSNGQQLKSGSKKGWEEWSWTEKWRRPKIYSMNFFGSFFVSFHPIIYNLWRLNSKRIDLVSISYFVGEFNHFTLNRMRRRSRRRLMKFKVFEFLTPE